VVELIPETPRTTTILLEAPEWPGHRAGQHVDVRLTAEDGYQALRSYSIASGPEDPQLAMTVERIDDGEVSPYLVGELRGGDQVELRGPVGGHFVWDHSTGGWWAAARGSCRCGPCSATTPPPAATPRRG
jgi:ferredoxin-NADP reductase